MKGGAAAWDYCVSLHRARYYWEYEVWAFSVRDILPTVRVPLLAGMRDALLDLQAIFERAYDEGPYARRVGYGAKPNPPLAEGAAAWADALLRGKGLRP